MILVAGDSNVLRLQAAAVRLGDSITKFLPVSGSRFTNDRKNFRSKLLKHLETAVYRKIYVVLGSNDNLSDLSRFYREVSEVLDLLTGNPDRVEVVVCAILPRSVDMRPTSTTRGRLHRLLKWIRQANSILEDIAFYRTSVRFLDLDGFLAKQHLCMDGLHLNHQGADYFLNHILTDSFQSSYCPSDELVGCCNEWPVLGTEVVVPKWDEERMLFSDAVRTGKVISVEKTLFTKTSTKKNYELAKKSWLKKKFTRFTFRNEENSHIYVALDEETAVWLKASKITGRLLNYQTEHQVGTAWRKPVCEVKNDPNKQKQKNENMWLLCPDCDVRCSREDFLLDHICRRHSTVRLYKTEDEKGRKVVFTDVFGSEEKALSKDFLSLNSEMIWKSLFPFLVVGWMCGDVGLHLCVLNMVIANHVNLSRLLLLLSNDVEQNPGPVYRCKWESCDFMCNILAVFKYHVFEHSFNNVHCQWTDCGGFSNKSKSLLYDHMLEHIDNEPDMTFSSIDEWLQWLPDGELKDETNLHLCPPDLRSKLQLLFFDEDFKMKSNPYTVADHKLFVHQLSTFETTKFNQMLTEFKKKNIAKGEIWTDYKIPEPFYLEPKLKFHFVEAGKQEITIPMSSESNPQTGSYKRKQPDMQPLTENQVKWSEILMKNLSDCDQAIQIQRFVFDSLIGNSLLQHNKQSFLKVEQESAKLASIIGCTQGTFVCSVFKCLFREKQIYYVRYFESGVYSGLMLQKYLQLLKVQYNASDDNIMLHNVITAEDIIAKTEQNNTAKKVKREKSSKGEVKNRTRPDKSLAYSLSKVLPLYLDELNNFGECEEVKLDAFVVHILPFKSKVTVDTFEKMFLQVKNPPLECLKQVLLDFRLNSTEASVVNSKDILCEPTVPICNLLQQSIMLNCLSGDIKRKPNLFSRSARFESNCLNFTFLNDATSLRNKTILLYEQNNVFELVRFFLKYFPDLCESSENVLINDDIELQTVNCQNMVHIPSKKPKRSALIASKSNNSVLPTNNLNENPMSLFENYCLSLVERGKMVIQRYEDSSNFVCCMNDYNEVDGSFRESDFIYTTMQRQELGYHFECTCKTYHTSISLKNSQHNDPEYLALVPSGDNFVTCIHCRFLKEKVAPCLDCSDDNTNKLQMFIKGSLCFPGKNIVQLFCKKDTQKFSVLPTDEDKPSIVHLSKNKNLGFIVSCFNGRCLSMKGHKRMLTTLASAHVCKHLTILKDHTEYWQDLIQEQLAKDINVNNDRTVEEGLAFETDTEGNFDEYSGLWSFKCRSLHSPNQRDNPALRVSVIKRDAWNDNSLQRSSDGYLKGPVLVADIPNNTCNCGSGWLKCPGDENYNENGLSVNDRNRHLTIYTSTAPVKCEVHTRLCYNAVSPCTLPWDEGKKDSLHVLSRDTAAGDEIGWEFVNMVLSSGCTFSSFCQMKTSTYQLRAENGKFMDPSVFLKWWFSWAANMKIDFRKPCDICGFEPKRLCCDGTKVGVGFRHAKYEEINSFDENSPSVNTLHRRMDRCFLKNMNGIEKAQMIRNRETLNYLSSRVLGKIPERDQFGVDELAERIEQVKHVLPDEVQLSFERFFSMNPSEEIAYAHVLKMLSTTASITSLLPPAFCENLLQLVQNPDMNDEKFNEIINSMRSYAPELRDLICESMLSNDFIIPDDIRLLIQYLINESLDMATTEPEVAIPQPGTYNPAKFGRAYYFNESGLKLRNVRQFSIDQDTKVKRNVDHDDNALEFERCQKLYSKVHVSAHATSNLFLWFCADHGHCYGFHMTGAEGRKDPAASLYSHLEKPPQDIFYDFACNLQEYCLNRESGFYKNVRFFHDIFHSYAHKCSCSFKSRRLQGFETVNSEICEQFNSFIQCIKKSARQMSQEHFCFYLQFFLHEWNQRKQDLLHKKVKVAVAGIRE